MSEAGVDISNHKSKHVDELKDIKFDYVITVCDHANEHCPVFSGDAKIIHVGFEDPPKMARKATNEQQAIDCYRKVRDEIKSFVEKLPDSLNKS
jgi:arsenate reductase